MFVKRTLQWVMLLSGGISACNLLAFYFMPLIFPAANFSIIKLTFIAIEEKKYGYILISCLLIALIFIGAVSIKRAGILFPILSCAIFFGDVIHVGYLFVKDLLGGYFNTIVIWSGIVDIMAIVLFALYFLGQVKDKSHKIKYC